MACIKPFEHFNPTEDATALEKAMKGFGKSVWLSVNQYYFLLKFDEHRQWENMTLFWYVKRNWLEHLPIQKRTPIRC